MSLLEKLSESIINDMGKVEDFGTNEILRNNQSIPEYSNDVDMDSLLDMDNQNDLKEIIINPNLDSLETITLKKPNQVYYEIYKEARKKAKLAKKTAIVAFLEAKNIKKTYMLDDLDESDSDSYNDSDNSDSDNNDNSDNDNDSDVEIMDSNN